jgi:DNA-binding ferritin-like protein (Dps family)
VNKLPEEYRKAMKAIETYMWNYAKGSGMLELLKNILEMFENSESDGLSVRDVVGDDIAGFADSLLAEFPEETWMDKMRKKLRDSME